MANIQSAMTNYIGAAITAFLFIIIPIFHAPDVCMPVSAIRYDDELFIVSFGYIIQIRKLSIILFHRFLDVAKFTINIIGPSHYASITVFCVIRGCRHQNQDSLP